MYHWVNFVWSASSNYLNQFWVIVHYTPRKNPHEKEIWIKLLVNISIEGCDISMFILIIARNGGSHSVCDFKSNTLMLWQNGRRFARILKTFLNINELKKMYVNFTEIRSSYGVSALV